MRKLRISNILALTKASVGIFIFLLVPSAAFAQVNPNKALPVDPSQRSQDVSTDKGRDDSPGPLTTFEEEMRAKRAIRLAEKEHEANLSRAREISQLGQELKTALQSRAILGREDNKKLDRLEKLTKKIRGEAGGEDDDVQIAKAPADISSALIEIADNADQLSKEVQKTPRQVVSAAVIDRANILLELVKILRGLIH